MQIFALIRPLCQTQMGAGNYREYAVHNKSEQNLAILRKYRPYPLQDTEDDHDILPAHTWCKFSSSRFVYVITGDSTMFSLNSYPNGVELDVDGLHVTVTLIGDNITVNIEDSHTSQRKYMCIKSTL